MFSMMDPFVGSMSRKRSRCEDDDEEMSYSFGSIMDDSRKRRRNDTLTEDVMGFPSIAASLHQASVPNTYNEDLTTSQPIPLARPPLFRARTLPFRLPSFPTLSSLQSPEYASASSEQSSPESSSPSSLNSLHLFAELPRASLDLDTQLDTIMDTDMDAMAEDSVQIRGSVSPVSPFRVPQRPKQRPDIEIKVHHIERNQMTNGHVLTPFAVSGASSPHSQFSSQRLPTPMYTSFPAPSSSSLQVPPAGFTSSSPNDTSSFSNNSSLRKLPRFSPVRAMPSPIREDSMDDMITDYAGSQLSRLSVSEGMDMDSIATSQQRIESSSAVDITETLVEIPRKGRTRSGAMLSPTQRIFTGYMADCEKCRLNFPGHSMHILPA